MQFVRAHESLHWPPPADYRSAFRNLLLALQCECQFYPVKDRISAFGIWSPSQVRSAWLIVNRRRIRIGRGSSRRSIEGSRRLFYTYLIIHGKQHDGHLPLEQVFIVGVPKFKRLKRKQLCGFPQSCLTRRSRRDSNPRSVTVRVILDEICLRYSAGYFLPSDDKIL